MDNDELDQLEQPHAFCNDSAANGKSALEAPEERALSAELAKLEGTNTITLPWDIKKCFDAIDIATQIAEARRSKFPLQELALSLAVYHAPRSLKLGSALGQAIVGLGRIIIAGCKRSTTLARVYTLGMAEYLNASHPAVALHLHVDDTSNEVVAAGRRSLYGTALDYAIHLNKHTDRLLIDISEKHCSTVQRDN